VLLSRSHGRELSEPGLFLAIRLRTPGGRKLDFLTHVPLVPGAEPHRQAPKRLPMLRSTWPRSILFWGVLTAAALWWYSWWALVVPLYYGLAVYRNVRAYGRLPAPLFRLRYALDAAALAAAFLALWETPAAELAVPVLVTGIAYVAVGPVLLARSDTRIVVALCAGTAWLFLLGLDTRALSPCRIVDGTAGVTADSFVRALFSGDAYTARRLSRRDLPLTARDLKPLSPSRAAAAVGRRRDAHCIIWSSALNRFFSYDSGNRIKTTWVAVQCDGRSWRVHHFFRYS
jgi:hypothetical protein